MKFLRTVLFAAAIFSAAQAFSLSDSENACIQKILSFRLSLRNCATADDALSKITEFETAEAAQIDSLGEEVRLIATNMLVTARYNCEYEKDYKSTSLEKILRPNFERILAFKEKNPSPSNLFLISSADVINSIMQFLPRTDAIKYGLQEKKEYATVLENEPQMSLALINSALWYYFAPAVGGGSKSKAKTYFSDAFKHAASDYEKYYAAIYLSQFCFEQKDSAGAEQYLAEAEKVLPGTGYIAFIRELNGIGFSLYDYNNNSSRAKVKRKLAERQSE